jgi:anti-sigma B factor antagonist
MATMSERPFAVSVEAALGGSPAIANLTGELDVASAPELETCLLALGDIDIILDLARLTFVNSRGISVLIVALRRSGARGHRFVLRAPSAPVANVLRLTGVDQVLSVDGAV